MWYRIEVGWEAEVVYVIWFYSHERFIWTMVHLTLSPASSIELEAVSTEAVESDFRTETRDSVGFCEIEGHIWILPVTQRKDIESKTNAARV